MPLAFTEHGVTMLASVLRSGKAVQMSIAVVRAFIALKQFATQSGSGFTEQLQQLKHELTGRIDEHDSQLNHIYEALKNLLDKEADKHAGKLKWEERDRIGFNKFGKCECLPQVVIYGRCRMNKVLN